MSNKSQQGFPSLIWAWKLKTKSPNFSHILPIVKYATVFENFIKNILQNVQIWKKKSYREKLN